MIESNSLKDPIHKDSELNRSGIDSYKENKQSQNSSTIKNYDSIPIGENQKGENNYNTKADENHNYLLIEHTPRGNRNSSDHEESYRHKSNLKRKLHREKTIDTHNRTEVKSGRRSIMSNISQQELHNEYSNSYINQDIVLRSSAESRNFERSFVIKPNPFKNKTKMNRSLHERGRNLKYLVSHRNRNRINPSLKRIIPDDELYDLSGLQNLSNELERLRPKEEDIIDDEEFIEGMERNNEILMK